MSVGMHYQPPSTVQLVDEHQTNPVDVVKQLWPTFLIHTAHSDCISTVFGHTIL